MNIAFSSLSNCAFDKILYCLRKLISDNSDADSKLAFVCDFYFEQELEIKIASSSLRNKFANLSLSIDRGNKHMRAYCPDITRRRLSQHRRYTYISRIHHRRDKPCSGLSRHRTPTLNAALLMNTYFTNVTSGRGFSSEKKILAPATRTSTHMCPASINIGAIDKPFSAYQSRQQSPTQQLTISQPAMLKDKQTILRVPSGRTASEHTSFFREREFRFTY